MVHQKQKITQKIYISLMDKSVDSVPYYVFNFLNSPSPGVKYLNLGLLILDNYKGRKSPKQLRF